MLKCHHSYTHLSTEKRLEDAMLAKNAAQAQLDAKQAELDKVRCATFVTDRHFCTPFFDFLAHVVK